MTDSPATEAHPPSRGEALTFFVKSRLLQARRGLREWRSPPPRHPRSGELAGAPVAAEVRSELWTETSAAEFPLTAGKVENLRLAARALDGIEVPPGETFSFWRQLGRTTRSKGFTRGRELRGGCLVPSTGGGLCQLTGLLYQAALDSGFQIVERHSHSRAVATGPDATIFWNYVDLRFRAPVPWRLEVQLDATHLVVRTRIPRTPATQIAPNTPAPDDPPRPATSGDCLTCGETACFRHPAATADHAPALGHSAFLLDARWPELDRFCATFSRPGDRWFIPLDARRWRKPVYAWSPPPGAGVQYATLPALLRSFRVRRLPAQGAVRQRVLLSSDAALADYYAARISPECRHLVVSQNLLPRLHDLGVLGGRTFDVLLQRWPLAELHRHLDAAASAHPGSPTLADFRAPTDLVRAEEDALAAAARVITPHRALADRFGPRAWLLDWDLPPTATPAPIRRPQPGRPLRLLFPFSPLGRKGIHELAKALPGLDAELLVLGSAREGGNDPLDGLRWRPANPSDLPSADALVLPAWVEHHPRLALQALAQGIPVIATAACGLPEHPHLHVLDSPDPTALAAAVRALKQR